MNKNKKRKETLLKLYAEGKCVPWNKGLSKDNDERLKKVSEKFKKRYDDGYVNPFEGKRHSDETKKKQSEVKKGKKQTEESNRKRSETLKKKFDSGECRPWNEGKHLSEEHKNKVSIANTGQKRPDEFKKKMSDIRTGFKQSDETKKLLSDINTGRKHSDKTREKISIGNKGKECWSKGLTAETDDRIARQVEANKKTYLEGRAKIYPEYSTIKRGHVDDLGHYTRSGWETNICRYLKFMNVDYEYEPKVFRLQKDNNDWTTYRPDIYIEKYNLFIEIKGRGTLEKYNLFQKQYPEYSTLLIDEKKYYEIINSGIYYTNFTNFLEKHFNNKLEEVYY